VIQCLPSGNTPVVTQDGAKCGVPAVRVARAPGLVSHARGAVCGVCGTHPLDAVWLIRFTRQVPSGTLTHTGSDL